MPPATTVPMTPTISDTRAPKISRLEHVAALEIGAEQGVPGCAPSIQNGGSKILAPGIGSVGS